MEEEACRSLNPDVYSMMHIVDRTKRYMPWIAEAVEVGSCFPGSL